MRAHAVATVAAAAIVCGGLLVWIAQPNRGEPSRSSTADRRLTPFQQAKVEWLLEHRLSCLGCHAIEGRGGRLGPDLTHVGERLSPAAIAAHISTPGASRPGTAMPPVPMPPAWQELLVRYLSGPNNTTTGPLQPAAGGAVAHPIEGANVYRSLCSGCHGISGDGKGPNAPYLPVQPARHDDSTAMSRRSDDWLFDMVARGGYVMNRHPFMPSYGDLLAPAQIRAVVAYLRELCRCSGPAWSVREAP